MIGRVGDRATFEALRRTRWRGRRGSMSVAYVAGGDQVRVAYAIGRPVGSAVARNRLRRQLRAVVRELGASEDGLPAGAYLVRPRPDAVSLPYRALRADLSAAFASATRPPSTGTSPR